MSDENQGGILLKKFLSLIPILIVIAYLSANFARIETEVSLTDMSINWAPEEVKSFVNNHRDENGVHLMNKDQEKNLMYVYLNASNREEDAVYYKDFDVKVEDEIYHTYEGIEQYNQDQDDQKLYKIIVEDDFEFIDLYINGEESHFKSITES